MNRRFTVIGLLLSAAIPMFAQFQSGSTGADGALNFTIPGSYDFDPAGLGINAAGDNIFNFTTINIASGVTLRFSSGRNRGLPVVWRATGAVTIAGTLDMSGAKGIDVNPANPLETRRPAEPGPGGYWGGLGDIRFQSATSSATHGTGPGSPTTTFVGGQGGSHASPGLASPTPGYATGPTYGNASLNPLQGGSGGSGAHSWCTSTSTGNGGAGGGSMRIMSSVSVQVSGSILAKGGDGGKPDLDCTSQQAGGPGTHYGGGGSGGSVHLIAPVISGTGTIDVSGGMRLTFPSGGQGRIVLSSNTNSFTGTQRGFFTAGRLALPAPLTVLPSVRITSINGVAAPASPTGDFVSPDVTIAGAGPVTVVLAAANIPLSTVVKLTLLGESGGYATVNCTPLTGSVPSSSATCSATFPSGLSITSARATW
jgi:hypothetical protein